jgi:hypothetical protein
VAGEYEWALRRYRVKEVGEVIGEPVKTQRGRSPCGSAVGSLVVAHDAKSLPDEKGHVSSP